MPEFSLYFSKLQSKQRFNVYVSKICNEIHCKYLLLLGLCRWIMRSVAFLPFLWLWSLLLLLSISYFFWMYPDFFWNGLVWNRLFILSNSLSRRINWFQIIARALIMMWSILRTCVHSNLNNVRMSHNTSVAVKSNKEIEKNEWARITLLSTKLLDLTWHVLVLEQQQQWEKSLHLKLKSVWVVTVRQCYDDIHSCSLSFCVYHQTKQCKFIKCPTVSTKAQTTNECYWNAESKANKHNI